MRFRSRADVWTRKLHYYLGLCFLLFTWMFSLSGLVLNHGEWRFAQFWPQREQTRFERPVRQVEPQTDLGRARHVMTQVGIRGEVDWPAQPQAPGRLAFRVSRPGRTYEVDVDWLRGVASVSQTRVNAWGVLNALHHFNGVHAGDSRNVRDWLLTSAWAYSMDALAAGLIFVVLSGVYVWWRSGRQRTPGLVALLGGILACGLMLFGGS